MCAGDKIFCTLFYFLQKGTPMSDTSELELAQPVYNPTPEENHARVDRGPVCQPGDRECVARWVQAFSDCD